MDPFTLPCPQCHAEAGQKCTNYAGKGCAPHRLRLHPDQAEQEAKEQNQADAPGLFDEPPVKFTIKAQI